MKQIPINEDVLLDLNRTELDISVYMQDTFMNKQRVHKKGNSAIMLNFKKQMKKDSRLITNLCCKSANGKRIITPLP